APLAKPVIRSPRSEARCASSVNSPVCDAHENGPTSEMNSSMPPKPADAASANCSAMGRSRGSAAAWSENRMTGSCLHDTGCELRAIRGSWHVIRGMHSTLLTQPPPLAWWVRIGGVRLKRETDWLLRIVAADYRGRRSAAPATARPAADAHG